MNVPAKLGPMRRMLPALTILAGAFVVLPASGCNCELECDERPPVSREVVGTVTEVEDGTITLELDDGADDQIQVLVYGRASALDVGETYRVPLHELPPEDVVSDDLAVELPSANLDGSCDCGAPFITNADGSAVDTGILPELPLRKLGWGFLAAASIAIVSWASWRFRVNEPL